jgi:hypothetical protein
MTSQEMNTLEERSKKSDRDRVIDAEYEVATQDTDRAIQTPAPPKDNPVPNAGFGTPDVAAHSDHTNERWQSIQAQFVDDPRKAVGEAHELVGELVQRIVDGFTKERDDLEHQWSQGSDVSTEDLRVCLQHYRSFFSRLSPTANGSETVR